LAIIDIYTVPYSPSFQQVVGLLRRQRTDGPFVQDQQIHLFVGGQTNAFLSPARCSCSSTAQVDKFYIFSITPFITMKFKIIVIGVTMILDTMEESFGPTGTISNTMVFTLFKILDTEKIKAHW